MVDRRHLPRWLVGLGAATCLVGTFLPWLSSGSVARSSYELFSIVDRLGFSPDGAVGWALRLWPLAPLLLVLSAVSPGIAGDDRWGRQVRIAVPALAALYVGGTAAAVELAPEGGLFRLRFGIWVTLLGSLAMLVGVALCLRRAALPLSGISSSGSGPSATS